MSVQKIMASADRTRFSPEGSLALARKAARADTLVGRPVAVRPGSGDGRDLLSPVRRTVVAVVLLLLLPAGLVLAYWAGAIDRLEMTAALAPTELAPGAGGELEMRGSGSDVEANLEV